MDKGSLDKWSARIRECDYLDRLPDEGWIWEYRRRTAEYRRAVSYYRARTGVVVEDPDEEFCAQAFLALSVGVWFIWVDEGWETTCHTTVTFRDESRYKGLNHWAFPDYHRPHHAFKILPLLRGTNGGLTGSGSGGCRS